MKKTITKLALLFGVLLLLGTGSALAQDKVEDYNLYLRSNTFGGWNETSYRNKMTKVSDNEYYIYLPYIWEDFKITGPYLEGNPWAYDFDYGANDKNTGNGVSKNGNNFHAEISNTCKITLKRNNVNSDFIVTAEAVNAPIYALRGQLLGESWEDQQMVPTSVSNVWERLIYLSKTGGSFGIKKMDKNGTEQAWYNSNSSATIKNDNRKLFLRTSNNGDGSNPVIGVPAGRYYTFQFNTSTLELSLWRPEKLYLVGHINDGKFLPDNTHPMQTKGDGIFYLKNIEITEDPNSRQGYGYFDFCCANAPSLGITSAQDKYTNAEKAKIVAGWDYVSPRFGALENDKAASVDRTYDIQQFTENSFKLPVGYYDIEVNFNNMTVKFTQSAPLDFVWYNGSDELIATDSHTTHEVTFSKDDNAVQVGVGNDPYHDAANQAQFVVKYRELPATSGVSLLANDDYTLVTEEDGYYTLDTDKNIINLLKAGQYEVTASLNNHKTYDDTESTLYVTLNPLATDATSGDEIKVPFVTQGQTTFTSAIGVKSVDNLDLSNLTIDDFTITITPDTEKGDWVSGTDYASYLTAGTLFDQYSTLKATGCNIDGFYSEITDIDIAFNKENNGYYEYNVVATIPCSGVYNMTLQSKENYDFEDQDVTLEVYPDLYALFGTTPAFNVNGYGFTSSNKQVIQYTSAEATTEILANSVAYKPGTYFDTKFTVSVNGGEAIQGSRTNDNTSWVNIDLTPLVSASSISLSVVAEKNGASSDQPFTYIVQKVDVVTGVEGIEAAEEGEAVYYNLQGVRVANPEHGIFVKVVNGKASKVVL